MLFMISAWPYLVLLEQSKIIKKWHFNIYSSHLISDRNYRNRKVFHVILSPSDESRG